MPPQLPIKLRAGRKTDTRIQFAALCYRQHAGEVEVCLVTSRGTGRWILPKGWPMHKQTPAEAAATEAWEEAGLTGQSYDHCLGVYSYIKPLTKREKSVVALVYPVRVDRVHTKWPEKGERKRRWVSLEAAAGMVNEPELAAILRGFDPTKIRT